MPRIMLYSAWLFSIILVSLASAGAAYAATETVTLKNGKTYEVEVDRRGELVGAENRQVEMTFLGTSSHASPTSDSPAYVWMWNARLKRRGEYEVTVTTPIDETVSANFEVAGRGEIGFKFVFDSEEYPTLWTWLDEPETSWIPFVFTFEDTQSDNTFELTQWTRFDAPGKEAFVRAAYTAAGLTFPEQTSDLSTEPTQNDSEDTVELQEAAALAEPLQEDLDSDPVDQQIVLTRENYPVEFRGLTYQDSSPGFFANYGPLTLFRLAKQPTLTITETAISYQSSSHDIQIPLGAILDVNFTDSNEFLGIPAWLGVIYLEHGVVKEAYFGDGTPSQYDRILGVLSEAVAAEMGALSAVQQAARLASFVELLDVGEESRVPVPALESFKAANKDLGVYLDTNPNDVEALILFAQLERVVNLIESVVITGGEIPASAVERHGPAIAALDHAITLEPNNSEAHYWLGRTYGVGTPTNIDGRLAMEPLDLDRAISYTQRAMELLPGERKYREALAIFLALAQRYEDAMDTLREVDDGEHLIYRILSDLQIIPLPEQAKYLPLESASLADIQMNAGHYENYSDLRVRVYVFPGSASEFERALQQQWQDLELYEAERSDDGDVDEWTAYLQVLKWREDDLEPSTRRELSRIARGRDGPRDSMVSIMVMELVSPAEETQEQYQMVAPDRLSILTLMSERSSAD